MRQPPPIFARIDLVPDRDEPDPAQSIAPDRDERERELSTQWTRAIAFAVVAAIRDARIAGILAAVAIAAFSVGPVSAATVSDAATTVAQAGQTTTGTITGKVLDGAGKPLGGARIGITGPTSTETTTKPDGTYSVAVPPGLYSVTISAAGFQSQQQDSVAVVSGAERRPHDDADPGVANDDRSRLDERRIDLGLRRRGLDHAAHGGDDPQPRAGSGRQSARPIAGPRGPARRRRLERTRCELVDLDPRRATV
jgi:hypothetical protein